MNRKGLMKYAETKRKNPIELGDDSNLGSDFKPIKVGGKTTILDLSESTLDIKGSLSVNGDAVQTGTDAGATELNELSDVTYSSGDLTISSLDKIIVGDLHIDSSGDILIDSTNDGDATTGTIFQSGGARIGTLTAHHSLSVLTLYEAGGASQDDYFNIMVDEKGATTLGTVDAASAVAHLKFEPDGSFLIKETASAGADVAAYGQIWIKNSTPNELYFTTDAGDDIQLTSGTGVAGGGGGTDTWNFTIGGYKTNNNSATNYYAQYYPNFYGWTRSDSSPTSISYATTNATSFTADKDGALTNVRITMRAGDTGATDPLKYYVYKGTCGNNSSSTSCTLIGTSGTITPVLNRTMVLSTDFSSSNTFSEGDSLFVWLKKDSTSGNQDIYMSVTVSGTYD